jgi:hypothetical protein
MSTRLKKLAMVRRRLGSLGWKVPVGLMLLVCRGRICEVFTLRESLSMERAYAGSDMMGPRDCWIQERFQGQEGAESDLLEFVRL